MQLPGAVKKYFGFTPELNPFCDTPDDETAIFRWPAFDAAVDRIVDAVVGHRFLVVAGSYCSSKSTAWMLAREALLARRNTNVLIAEPAGLDPRGHDENTVYRAIVRDIGDGQKLKQSRAERAFQCKDILTRHIDASGADKTNCAAFVVNDAHCCRPEFLLICKRLWDQIHGFARMIGVVLIGQAPLHQAIQAIGEINSRRELLVLPGLGECVGDYVRFECERCGVDAKKLLGDDAIEAMKTLRSDRKFETADHPLLVSNVMVRALREAHRLKVLAAGGKIDAELITMAMRQSDEDLGTPASGRRGPRLAG
jgi:type II secretory pathway predicted ATPase ExeA